MRNCAIVEEWLAQLEQALVQPDSQSLNALFLSHSYWRDVLALRWNIQTLCGAILASGAHTLVMGARHDLVQSRWGMYTVEKLLELTNRTDQLVVITGILTQACADVRKLETKQKVYRD